MNVSRTSPIVPRPVPPPGAAPGGDSSPESAVKPSAQTATLWDVLTPDEREFFAREAKLGSITYRPSGAAAPETPAPTGQRIDVRG